LERFLIVLVILCIGLCVIDVGSGNSGGLIPEILARSADAGKSSSKFTKFR
jgi:hypothetical protein